MINLGNIEIADLRLGASQVKALCLGSEQMWSSEEPPVPVGDALCFTAEQANSTVQLSAVGSSAVGSPDSVSLEYSTDGSSWTSYEFTGRAGGTLTLANIGDKVYMRAKTENLTIGSSGSNYYLFIMTGLIDASGDIQTLLKADGSRTDAPTYCYFRIFQGCTSLTAAPTLPATTLAARCYQFMFNGCKSLTTAPSLPATTLASNCYTLMFNGCSSLSSVEVAFTSWSSTATSNWLQNVAASGTFTCPAELPDTRAASKIPEGWTKVDADPIWMD